MKKWISFVSVGMLCLPLLFNWQALEVLRLKVFDALVHTKDPSGHFVRLDITEKDLERMGGWPFPRKTLAGIHNELMYNGALGVGWVIAFPQPDRFGGDDLFNTALSASPSVLAMFENTNGSYPPTQGTVILGDGARGLRASGVIQNTPELRKNVSQGLATARADVDQLVRRMPLLLQGKEADQWVPTFGTEVLKILTASDTYIINTEANEIVGIKLPNLGELSTDAVGRRWVSWINSPRTTLDEMNVEGKFVFVGVSASGVQPQVATPAGLKYPHEIQASFAESLLVADVPYIPGNRLLYELVILLSVLTLVLIVIRTCTVAISAVGLGLIFSGVVGGGYYLIASNILIDVSYSVISLILISVQEFWLRFQEQFKLRQQIKEQFGHYLDPRQVQRLQDNPELLTLGGELKDCTFLFTDVRGFTSLSESLSPPEVTEIMNKALTVQVECVQAHGGMVDKFIGDACMAIFNAPLNLDEHAKAAVNCAVDMQIAIKELNKELSHAIAIGVGVNSGPAVIGNMGSSTRFDYSAIGDAVNTAARLESATKEAGVDILIGEVTAKQVQGTRFVKKMYVKGKKKPLKVYTI
jgi:adenylate cyclase